MTSVFLLHAKLDTVRFESSSAGLLVVRPVRAVKAGLATLICILIAFLLLATANCVVCILLGWIAIAESSGLAVFLTVVFAVGLLIIGWCCITMQGYCFPFTASVGDNRYSLVNGIVRYSRTFDFHQAIVVFYISRQGEQFGFGVTLRPGKGQWGVPLLEPMIIGDSRETMRTARQLQYWLSRHFHVGTIVNLECGQLAEGLASDGDEQRDGDDGE